MFYNLFNRISSFDNNIISDKAPTFLFLLYLLTEMVQRRLDGLMLSSFTDKGLFGFFNLCEESGARLLVTASAAPQQLVDMLPDLRSRLSSLPVFQMPHFSEEQIADLLCLRGEAIGLQLSEDVMRYCSVRLTRNPQSVVSFVNALDQLSLAQRRAVTVPFVRESGLLHLATGE